MKKVEVLIVEDEQLLAQELAEQLTELDKDIEIVGILGSIGDTVNWFKTRNCDLLFLDIHLNDGLSFSIFDGVKVQCPIIFTTAYDQYAIQAFEVNSIAYLLKPIEKEDLKKAWIKFKSLQTSSQSAAINQLWAYIKKKETKTYKKRLMLAKGKVQKPMRVDEIAYFVAENRYVFAIANNGQKYFCEHTLYELEEQLNPDDFFRANRTFLVSYESIEEIKPYGKGRLEIVLKPQTEQKIIISAEKSNDFKRWLKK